MFNRMEVPYSNGDSMAWTLQNIINKLKENWNKNDYKVKNDFVMQQSSVYN